MAVEAAFYDDIFGAIDAIAFYAYLELAAGRLFTAPEFGTQSGFKYIAITFDNSGDPYQIQNVMLPMNGPDALIPFQYLYPSMGGMMSDVLFSYPTGDPTRSAAIAAWVTAYIGTWMTAIEELTGGTCTLGDGTEVEIVTDVFSRQTRIVEVSTSGRTFNVSFEANIGPSVISSGPMANWYMAPTSYKPVGSITAGSSKALDAIAQNTADIAAQDFTMTINNGQSAFSVKGKTSVESP